MIRHAVVIALLTLQEASQAEVADLEMIILGHQDVPGCKVTVHDVLAAQVHHGLITSFYGYIASHVQKQLL